MTILTKRKLILHKKFLKILLTMTCLIQGGALDKAKATGIADIFNCGEVCTHPSIGPHNNTDVWLEGKVGPGMGTPPRSRVDLTILVFHSAVPRMSPPALPPRFPFSVNPSQPQDVSTWTVVPVPPNSNLRRSRFDWNYLAISPDDMRQLQL
jgi:hypothetical protein